MPNANKNKKAAVRLGLLSPLTGLVDLYGEEISRAARVACQEVNEQGGVLGHPLELVIEDDGSMPELAVPAAEKLIDRHRCVAIIGNLLSNSRIAVADHVSLPRKIPYLNFSFYEGSLFNRYFFNFAALPNQQIDKMIPYMANRVGPKMFFAGNNYEWPRGSIDAAKLSLQACGGEVVGEEYFPLGSGDFSLLMERLAKSGADVFVPYAAGLDQIRLLNQFSAAGLKKRMSVVMGHYDEAMVANLTPEVREGLYSSNTYFMSVPGKKNTEYLRRLAALPGVDGIWPEGNGITTNFGEGAYICVHAFAQAANAAGSLNAEALVAALETVRISAPQGEVIMDPVSHHASVNSYISRCDRDGRFIIVEKFGLIPPIIPERYHHPQLTVLQGMEDTPQTNDWQVLSILPYPLPDEDELSNPLLNRLFRIKIDLLTSRNLMTLLRRNSDEIKKIIEAGAEQVIEVNNYQASNGKERLLISPLLTGGKCTYLVISGETRDYPDGQQINGHALSEHRSIGLTDRQQNNDSELQDIFYVTDVGVIAVNEQGVIVRVNNKTCSMFGFSRDELMGMSVHLLLPPHMREVHKKNVTDFLGEAVTKCPMAVRPGISCYRKDGSFFSAEATVSKIKTANGWLMVATLIDVSDRRKFDEELVWLATHDSLTRLPNRTLINDRLVNALIRSVRSGKAIALMFVGINEFKLINDNYGHEVGDRLLKVVAKELTGLVRPGDTVGRFGGGEFVVICDQVNEVDVITTIAERIVARLKKPFSIGDADVFSSVSVGITMGFGMINSAESMLKNANAAMYNATARGSDGWMFFDNDIAENSNRFLKLANGLRTAVKNNELYILVQPITNSSSGQITGGEILPYWRHSDKEMLPEEFIPVAEMNGSILTIGRWLFESACATLHAMRQSVPENLLPNISVNMSVRQLCDAKAVDHILNTLQKNAVLPSMITIEVTEAALVSDVEQTISALRTMGRAGFLLEIDDFGAGYSSLNTLRKLPVNILKINKMLIDEIGRQDDALRVISAIVGMAHALGLKVAADGVETKQQLQALAGLGCDSIQGGVFYPPVPVDEFIRLCIGQAPGAEKAV